MSKAKILNPYYQSLRGVAIICVVIIHSLGNNSEINSINLFIRECVNFCVGLFLFLSACFIKGEEVYKLSFYTKRLQRIVIPFLIFSLFYTLYSYVCAIDSGIKVEFEAKEIFKIITITICGLSAAHLYYLVVLIQLIVLTPILYRFSVCADDRVRYIPLLSSFLFSLALFINAIFGDGVFAYYHYYSFAWLSFFYLGLLYKNNDKIFLFLVKRAYLLVCIAFIFSLACAYCIYFYNPSLYSFATSQLKFSSICLTCCAILLSIRLKESYKSGKFSRVLEVLGDYSFGIYFVHLFFLILISKHIDCGTYILDVLMKILLTIIISFLFIFLFKKLTNCKFDRYLGF